MENTFNPLNSWSFTSFTSSRGIPNVQQVKTANGSRMALVFEHPITGDETYVSISNKLIENFGTKEQAEEYLDAHYLDLQVCQTEPDADTMARRKERALERAKEGKKTQLESFVLCPKGEGTRKRLNLAFLANLG